MSDANTPGIAPPDGGAAAISAAAEAARERQSHVRHELRAPLAVMYPLLSLLRDGGAGALRPEQAEYLDVLERSVVRMEALVTGAAASGWADCSAAPSVPSAVPLRQVAEELIALRRVECAEGAAVILGDGARSPLRAWADLDDVRQIAAALVRNAAAYTPASGSITISVRAGEAERTVVLEVADTGPGIPLEELDRVFEFGFRGGLAAALKIPGLGAGLWICRELTRRNGGGLTLTSEAGAGVTATLTVPAAVDGAREPAAADASF